MNRRGINNNFGIFFGGLSLHDIFSVSLGKLIGSYFFLLCVFSVSCFSLCFSSFVLGVMRFSSVSRSKVK